jgi:heat shock protein HslJ
VGRRDLSTRTCWSRRGVLLLTVGALMLSACGGNADNAAADDTTTRPDDSETATTQQQTESTPAETAPDEGTDTIDPPLELAGTSWVITNYNYSPSDTGITNPLGEEAVLVLGEDGTLTGHTGCNEFTGTWETTGPYYIYDSGAKAFEDKVDGQPLTITADVATSVECEGWVAEQDVDIIGALVAAEIWYIGNLHGDEDGGITLHSETGRVYADPA